MRKIVLLLLPVLIFSLALAFEYQVDKQKSNLVKFISNAPLENFEGVTDRIDGYITWDDGEPTKNSELYFEVDLNSIDTGIGLRNRHMRENYLETDRFPFAHFSGKVTSAEKLPQGGYRVTAAGTIQIHGVERPLQVSGTLSPAGDHVYRIETEFTVKLPDFNIKVPKLMFMKIDENIRLQVRFFVSPNNS